MLSTNTRRWIITLFGGVLIVFGLIYGLFWENIFNYIIEKNMILRPNSMIFDVWKTPPVKLSVDIYFFNWTNAQEFNDPNIKPHFEELGPYRFTERPKKVDLNWHPENASITYTKNSIFHFDAAASNGTLEDYIVSINAVAIGVATRAKDWNSFRRTFVDLAFNMYNYDIKITKTVDEFLFTGYKDALMDAVSILPTAISGSNVAFDRVSYCYGRNGSSMFYGNLNIHTGADDINKIGKIHTWNNSTTNKYYTHGECKKLPGTAGEFQSPHLQVNSSIDIFLPDICRSISLDYEKPVDIDGVQGFQYIGGPRSVDNGSLYPENACYCNGECVPSGVMNISSCFFDVPIFVSYPHFYNADPYYVEQLEGLKPEKDKHEFSMVLEQRTGLVLDLAGRFQINVLAEPLPYTKLFRNIPKIFFPLLWFEVKTHVTADLLDYLKPVPRIILSGQIFGGFLLLLGVLMIAWHPLNEYLNRRRGVAQRIEITNIENEENEQRHMKEHLKDKVVNMLLPEASPLIEQMRHSIIMLEKQIELAVSGERENAAAESLSTNSTDTDSNKSPSSSSMLSASAMD